jgi:flagellar M-ring protein FliF
LLEPVIGPNNLRATVVADIDFSQVEQTSEAYVPNQGASAPQAIRSQQSNESQSGGSGASGAPATGVPGALANQPPVPAQAPINGASAPLQAATGGSAGGATRRDNVINYELDKTVRVTRQATGQVKRLSTAVVLNHRTKTDAKGKTTTEPLPESEVERLTALVREAIGFNAQRGDTLQIISAPFVKPEVVDIDVPVWQQPWVRDLVGSGAVPMALVLVALIVVFGMVRPAIKAAYPEDPKDLVKVVPAGAQLSEVVGDTPALDAPKDQLGLPALEAPIDATKLERARMLAQANPMAVANIVRAWMNGEEPAVD